MVSRGIEVRKGKSVPVQPEVCVIMPAYNIAQYVEEALDSVFAQTYTGYEIVVVNDGSPDTPQLERVLHPYWDRITYAKQENRGLAGARNTAVRLTQAPYIALLDGDDIWLPEYLAVQMEMHERDSTIDVLSPDSILFGESPEAGKTHSELNPSGEVTFEGLILQTCSVMGSVTAKRDTILRVGMFDEKLRSSEDFDLWLRILSQGGRIVYHKRVLHRYRRRCDSLSANTQSMYEHAIQVLQKVQEDLGLTKGQRDAVNEGLINFRSQQLLWDGKDAFRSGNIELAIEKFEESNKICRSKKLDLLIPLMTIAPGLILHLYRARERLNFNPETRN